MKKLKKQIPKNDSCIENTFRLNKNMDGFYPRWLNIILTFFLDYWELRNELDIRAEISWAPLVKHRDDRDLSLDWEWQQQRWLGSWFSNKNDLQANLHKRWPGILFIYYSEMIQQYI